MEYIINIPYGLKREEIKPEPGFSGSGLKAQLEWLVQEVRTDEEADRIMRAAVILYAERKDVTFDECIETAAIWERG